ncbi:hypothetical protein [Roseomonas sp. WA12]
MTENTAPTVRRIIEETYDADGFKGQGMRRVREPAPETPETPEPPKMVTMPQESFDLFLKFLLPSETPTSAR